MAKEIKLPRLGQGMDEGKILKWLKAEGDSISKGEEIYEVETEKVNVEVESPAAGTILKIVVGEGEEVPIGTVIAWVGTPGEAIPDSVQSNGAGGSAAAAPSTPGAAAQQSTQPAVSAPVVASTPVVDEGGRIKASPLARKIAGERGVDIAGIQGSGPDGRIIARDIEQVAGAAAVSATGPASTGAATAGGSTRVELTSMRRTIARRLTEAWQAPAFYLTVDIDMEQANDVRARLLARTGEGEVRPTVSDVITRACGAALRRHQDMNAHFAGDAIIQFENAHIGMAVATDAGLVVPVIRNAHASSIREIAAQRSALVKKARDGKLAPADFEGGTFTISNLGMMGIDEFAAVLNPPMAGILAIGRTRDAVVAVDGQPAVRPMMTVTLGCDHRAVDGVVGARFLATLKEYLEDPTAML